MKPIPMFPVAPPPRDDVGQAPIAQQVEAAPGEVELDAVVRAQSSAPQVVKRLTTLEDCLWAAVDALAKLPEKVREVLDADTIIERAKFLLRGDLELPEHRINETSGQHASTEPPTGESKIDISCAFQISESSRGHIGRIGHFFTGISLRFSHMGTSRKLRPMRPIRSSDCNTLVSNIRSEPIGSSNWAGRCNFYRIKRSPGPSSMIRKATTLCCSNPASAAAEISLSECELPATFA